MILDPVFIIASNYYKTASFFTHGGHSNWKKQCFFRAVDKWMAMLFAKFHAGARKSLSNFSPPLLEQLIIFVLILKGT